MSDMRSWERYRRDLCVCASIGLTLDVSRMGIDGGFVDSMADRMALALGAMEALEGGAIANPDEGRMVGHYWLRDASRAPTDEIRRDIERAVARIKQFAVEQAAATGADRFTHLLVIGIGGSALGPQFVADALGRGTSDRLAVHFFDNTDPDGVARELDRIGDGLKTTLAVVISKSGGTPETRNGMMLAAEAFEGAGLDFAAHAVAITGDGSKLDERAEAEGWRARFPMWDWVGGRTSVLGPVGLLPAALQGVDVDGLLAGAAACDAVTRGREVKANPAALMALAWYHATNGRGERDMVVLPYKDRLLLLSRYLQQLIMESLGKRKDLDGQVVEQGIAVYGNKGSTDQHAYVQQLRDGVDNFFAVFVKVLADGGSGLEVEPGTTAGDYLRGFHFGTQKALAERGRLSMTLTLDRLDAGRIGGLIALFERAVGFYASLVNVNAYHQPGVEAGKKAAAVVLSMQGRVIETLGKSPQPMTAQEVAEHIGELDEIETIHGILMGMAANRAEVTMDCPGHLCDAVFAMGPPVR